VLAKDIANARDIYDAAEGHAVIGVLSAQFPPWKKVFRK
jgi:2-dehydro-3-deoxy-phosphogluconate aldolase